MGTIQFKKPVSQKEQQPNIDVQNCIAFCDQYVENIQRKREAIATALPIYNKATKNIKMIDGDVQIQEMSRFLNSDIDEEIRYLLNRTYTLVEQFDKRGNRYILLSIIERCENLQKIAFSIIKETPSHTLYYYKEAPNSNGSNWNKTTWQSQYGVTYKQMQIIQHDTIEADVLQAVLLGAPSGISDNKLDKLIEENRPLLELYKDCMNVQMLYVNDKDGKLLLVPPIPMIGCALSCKDGEIKISQFMPYYLLQGMGEQRQIPGMYLFPVDKVGVEEAKRFIEKQIDERATKENMESSNLIMLMPVSSKNCILIKKDEDINVEKTIADYQLTNAEAKAFRSGLDFLASGLY